MSKESKEDIELRKITRWVRNTSNAGAIAHDWDWDGELLTVFGDTVEKYSRKDLEEEGVI